MKKLFLLASFFITALVCAALLILPASAHRYLITTEKDGHLNTTDVLDASAQIWADAAKIGEKNGFNLYFRDEESKPVYLNVLTDEAGAVSLEYSKESYTGFYYDATTKAWTCLVDETEYYLGLDGINRIGVYPVAEIAEENAPSVVVMYMHRGAAEAKEQTKLLPGYAYRMGAPELIIHEHQYGNWQKHNSTQHSKSCICDHTALENHHWDEGVVILRPTAIKEGAMALTCIDCGEVKYEVIPAMSKLDKLQRLGCFSVMSSSSAILLISLSAACLLTKKKKN